MAKPYPSLSEAIAAKDAGDSQSEYIENKDFAESPTMPPDRGAARRAPLPSLAATSDSASRLDLVRVLGRPGGQDLVAVLR